MNDDPIVASVRKIREDLAAAFDYDVHAIFATCVGARPGWATGW